MMSYVDYKDELVYNVKKLYHNLDLMSDAYPNLSNWIMYRMNTGVLGYDADVTQGALQKLVVHQQKYGYFKDCSLKKQGKYNAAGYKYEIIDQVEVKEIVEEKKFRADTMNSFWNTFKIFLRICMVEELGLMKKQNTMKKLYDAVEVPGAKKVLDVMEVPDTMTELDGMNVSGVMKILDVMEVPGAMKELAAMKVSGAMELPDDMTVSEALKVLDAVEVSRDIKELAAVKKVLDAKKILAAMKVLDTMKKPDAEKVLYAMKDLATKKKLTAMEVQVAKKVIVDMKVPDDMRVPGDKFRVADNKNIWLYHFADNFPNVYKNPENIAVLDKFDKFAKLTHTIGDFLIVPAECPPKSKNSFNVLKGGNDIDDYFDLTLKDIKLYYDTRIDNPKVETLLIKKYNNYWLEIYGTFEKFIDCNSLNMYVEKTDEKDENGNNKYTCKSLFDTLERGNIKMPKTEQQHRKDINEFLDNVIYNINKRNNEIELALKAECRFE